MKNPRHPVFRPPYPPEDSCVKAAHDANERYLRGRQTAEKRETTPEQKSCKKQQIPCKDHWTSEEVKRKSRRDETRDILGTVMPRFTRHFRWSQVMCVFSCHFLS